jgi:hypothetical protein
MTFWRSGKRHHFIGTVVVLALTILVAAGCSAGSPQSVRPTSPPSSTQSRVPLDNLLDSSGFWKGGVTHNAWTTGVEIDDGGLVVVPAPANDTPKLPYAAALARFRSSTTLVGAGQGVNYSAAFGYGLVTIGSGVSGAAGAPRYQSRLAWIGFVRGAICPGGGAPGSTGVSGATGTAGAQGSDGGRPPGWQAWVMDAATGNDVVSYHPDSYGEPSCRGGAPTVTSNPPQEVSIPWTPADAVELLVRYDIACGSTFDEVVWSAPSSGSSAPVQVLMTEPFTPGVHCQVIRSGSQPLLLPDGLRAIHGSIGPFAVYTGAVNAASASQVPAQPLTIASAFGVSNDRWVVPVELDGGELAVTPAPPGRSPTISFAVAMAKMKAKAASGEQLAGFAYGLVSIAASLTGNGLPSYQRRLAWIGFIQGPVYHCPAEMPSNMFLPPIAGPGSTPGWVAVVIDGATGGDTVIYASRGSPCNSQSTGPTVTAG